MKILFIQDSLGTGGAERSNAELWYFLRQNGVKIKIIVLEHRKEGIEEEILAANFDVEFLNPATFLKQSHQIRHFIKTFQPDLVHSVLFRASLRTRLAKISFNFKHIESLVNCSYAEIRYNDPKINSYALKFYEKLDQFTQNFWVDHFIAITNEVKYHYKQHLKIKENKISVIYRGRKNNEFVQQRELIRKELFYELDLVPEGLIFINVGRQEFQKAHLDILKAIKIADNELEKVKAQFLFCGRKGNATDEIEKFLSMNKLKTKIRFLGHRNDIYKLLAASDVFVFPSLYEGLGGSLIEAQAAGLPVVCSDIPVFKEVVTPLNALFHKTNDPKSLSVKLKEIVSTNNLEEMGRHSLQNYFNNFQLKEINQNMLDFYKKMIQ